MRLKLFFKKKLERAVEISIFVLPLIYLCLPSGEVKGFIKSFHEATTKAFDEFVNFTAHQSYEYNKVALESFGNFFKLIFYSVLAVVSWIIKPVIGLFLRAYYALEGEFLNSILQNIAFVVVFFVLVKVAIILLEVAISTVTLSMNEEVFEQIVLYIIYFPFSLPVLVYSIVKKLPVVFIATIKLAGGFKHVKLNRTSPEEEEWMRKVAFSCAAGDTKTAEELLKNPPGKKKKEINSPCTDINDANKRTALEDLNAMIGLEPVKKQIKEIIAYQKYYMKVGLTGGAEKPQSALHMIFTGNPGTGKTEVARILGRILQEIGYLKSGHLVEVSRADLVGQYIGHSEQKVREVVRSALGGILFIDEAYSLAKSELEKDSYGTQAINVLLKEMEDKRDNLVVIAAGYRKEMAQFLNSNPGLKSRFPITVDFPDYTKDELKQIFLHFCNTKGYSLHPGAYKALDARIEEMTVSKGSDFGNARAVRNLFEETLRRLSLRVEEQNLNSKKDLFTIMAEDVMVDESAADIPLEDLMKKLDSLVGMDSLKKQIRDLVSYVKYEKERKKRGKSAKPICLHLLFAGNPGTGKTTVARMLGEIYHKLGLLTKGHVIETDRSGLVAGYVGQTEIKTNAVIDSAQGGILFIDEAYALFSGDNNHDYGKIAVDIIIKRMEDGRGDFMVIMAGYPKEMDDLIASNPGFESRFAAKIHFPDYTDDELLEIMGRMCAENGDIFADDAYVKLRDLLPLLREKQGFANAREIRKIYERARINRAVRVEQQKDKLSSAEFDIILPEDIQLE